MADTSDAIGYEPKEGDLGQCMACLSCALAGTVPPSHFPLEPGLWDRPCPQCGAETVWVTEVYDPAVGPT